MFLKLCQFFGVFNIIFFVICLAINKFLMSPFSVIFSHNQRFSRGI